jgi:uncharacterized membrane protein
MEQRIRTSALFVCAGLVVAVISLLVNHPLAFIVFILVGVLLVVVGVAIYLLALLRQTPHTIDTTVAVNEKPRVVVEDAAP